MKTPTASRPLPGTVDVPGREFLYLEWSGETPFEEIFPTLLQGGAAPMPASGGMLNEAASLTTPAGRVYRAVSYRGDRAGFRTKLTEWCNARGTTWAQIEAMTLRCSDGEIHPLGTCRVELR